MWPGGLWLAPPTSLLCCTSRYGAITSGTGTSRRCRLVLPCCCSDGDPVESNDGAQKMLVDVYTSIGEEDCLYGAYVKYSRAQDMRILMYQHQQSWDKALGTVVANGVCGCLDDDCRRCLRCAGLGTRSDSAGRLPCQPVTCPPFARPVVECSGTDARDGCLY